MKFKRYGSLCLCSAGGMFPAGCEDVAEPFAPLVFLVNRSPLHSRGMYAISHMSELFEQENLRCLLPALDDEGLPVELAAIVAEHGATVLNTVFRRGYKVLERWLNPKRSGLKVTLVGLGDVGGTVLTGLKLLGREIDEIAIFDPNRAQCERYEMELNQVLTEADGETMPRVTICPEDKLFDCDLFLFTASRGVPAVGSQVGDVRMAQFEANRAMLDAYAAKARAADFCGLFCQISDPVDHLSRSVFLRSNRDDDGMYDFAGLLPEQIQGFGLGVMAARAAYYADKNGVDFINGRAYGPHGEGLIIANSCGDDYDDVVSVELTRLTREANLRVRDLGFKPYIAPGLSSAAVSILRLLRGQEHYGAIPIGGAYFGCVNRLTPQGIVTRREKIHPELYERIQKTWLQLCAAVQP